MFRFCTNHTKILLNIYKEGLYTNDLAFRRHYREQFAKRLLEFTQIANMTEETDEFAEELTDNEDETWDDGLTESEIQNVIGFLRCLQREYDEDDEEEHIQEDTEDEHSTASMTTVGETVITQESRTETDETDDETWDDDDDAIILLELGDSN